MAQKITPRNEDFSQWYQDLVLQARLADYSPVKGCMVIRPQGYGIWEQIQKDLDRRIKEAGAQNAYFPLLIPESFLKKEAEHVEGFAPECAMVTHAGGKELEEKLVIRPTSETIINSMFSKWIQSYRDLPMRVNQWANVVRWEMRTRLFLRTTEFLWQEGHTCHATSQQAEEEAKKMLEVYRVFAEEVLAMPVIVGQKTESEKFAGASKTYCVEAMMQDGKALQAGTSHDLGTHFAKAFDIKYLDREGKTHWVHQTSWGVSTRLIGGLIMTHSDDRGLVLPPYLAGRHVVIVPILQGSNDRELLIQAEKLQEDILRCWKGSYELKVHIDRDSSKQVGWKFHEYELLGVCLRIELGIRDLKQSQAVLVRRDEGVKHCVALERVGSEVAMRLGTMQSDLFEKARLWRQERMHEVEDYGDFKTKLEKVGGFFVAPWCQKSFCEACVKEETKATIRCLPWGEDLQPQRDQRACLFCRDASSSVRAIFAKNY